RDHGLAEAEAVGQRARGHLRRVQVGGNIDVAHRNETEQRRLVNELVQENDVLAYIQLGCARDEALAISLPLLANEVGMRRAEDDINGVRSAAKDRRHGGDDIFDPLVRGKETEGEDDSLAREAEARLCLFRLGERYVRNAVRNHLD